MLLATLLLAAAARASAASCAFPAPPVTLSDDGHEVVRVYSAPDSAPLLADAPAAPPELAAYRAWARARTDTDAVALLRRQETLYRRIGFKDGVEKLSEALNGRAGRLGGMNCLETLLFAEHERRFPTERGATEFMAFVLRDGAGLKIYFLSQDLNNGTAPDPAAVKDRVLADLRAGLTMIASLHNHPFEFDNPSGDIGGTTVASGNADYGDVSAFRLQVQDYGLREAWITNGFDTIRLDRGVIDRLNRKSAP